MTAAVSAHTPLFVPVDPWTGSTNNPTVIEKRHILRVKIDTSNIAWVAGFYAIFQTTMGLYLQLTVLGNERTLLIGLSSTLLFLGAAFAGRALEKPHKSAESTMYSLIAAGAILSILALAAMAGNLHMHYPYLF